MSISPEELEVWSFHGEVPSTDPDHKVVTTVDQETHSVIGDRRTEIIIGGVALTALSVAGVLAARHHLHVRHKHRK